MRQVILLHREKKTHIDLKFYRSHKIKCKQANNIFMWTFHSNHLSLTFYLSVCFIQNLQFHGVMRFYFQDRGQKVATKCIRVASDATVTDVIGML